MAENLGIYREKRERDNQDEIGSAIEYFGAEGGMHFRAISPRKFDLLENERVEASGKFDQLLDGLDTDRAGEVLGLAAFYVGKPRFFEQGGENARIFVYVAERQLGRRAVEIVDLIGEQSVTEDKYAGECLRAAGRLMDPSMKEKAIKTLDGKFDFIRDSFNKQPDLYADILKFYFEFGYKSPNYQKAREIFINLIRKPNSEIYLPDFVNDDSVQVREVSQNGLFQHIEDKFEVDGRNLLDNWKSVYTEFKKSYEVNEVELKSNLMVMNQLERRQPGSVKYLVEQYGVTHFSRYPVDLLAQQYAMREVKDREPYFVVIYPAADSNGAFNGIHDESIANFYADAQQFGRSVKVIEASSGKELIGRLNRLHRRNGIMAGGIVGAHGEWNSMQFGRSGFKDSYVTLKDLFEVEIKGEQMALRQATVEMGIKKYSVENSTWIFNACSTGQLGGMAMWLSENGVNVIAPDIPALVGKIRIFKIGDELILTAEYPKNDLYPQAKTMRYAPGVVVE